MTGGKGGEWVRPVDTAERVNMGDERHRTLRRTSCRLLARRRRCVRASSLLPPEPSAESTGAAATGAGGGITTGGGDGVEGPAPMLFSFARSDDRMCASGDEILRIKRL
jgi:hypothetical protein